MRYRVELQISEGRAREVDVQITDGSIEVRLDGEPYDAEIRQIDGGISVQIGGRSLDILIGAEGTQLASGGLRVGAKVESERQRRRKKRSGGSGSSKSLNAPMPGLIVKILVAEGDEVAEGTPLVVMEAMKMENELRAPAAAKVASIEVAEGQNVESNALLLRFE